MSHAEFSRGTRTSMGAFDGVKCAHACPCSSNFRDMRAYQYSSLGGMNDFMGGSSFAIASGTGDNLLLLCSGQVSYDFGGHSQGKYAGWNVFMFRDEGASSNHGIGANVGVRQHYGIHAYEDIVFKGRAVDDGSM